MSNRYIAITREVSPSIARCELTHLDREIIDLEAARAQHREYEDLLAELGCQLHRLPAEPELPDAVFVEDAAVVLDEIAVITRPGAASRRAETASIAKALEPYRRLLRIEPPATLDGGDVMRVGRTLYVGLSSRTGEAGVEQLRQLVGPFGYQVMGVPIEGCLHLKTAVCEVGEGTLLINRAWVDGAVFEGLRLIDVDPGEPFAANTLRIGEQVVYPAAFPATRARLESAGMRVRTVEASELAKAEGGVSCCSLVLESEVL